MTVTYQKPVRIDPLTWRLKFSSNVATPVPFRVFREGALIGEFTSPDGKGQVDVLIVPGDFPFFEVLDKKCSVAAPGSPGRIMIHWLAVASTKLYRVEELVSAVWTLRSEVPDDGRGTFAWTSRWLADVTTHQFRIIPVSTADNQGTVLAFSILMVRHPDTPAVTYAYTQATGKVTISAA